MEGITTKAWIVTDSQTLSVLQLKSEAEGNYALQVINESRAKSDLPIASKIQSMTYALSYTQVQHADLEVIAKLAYETVRGSYDYVVIMLHDGDLSRDVAERAQHIFDDLKGERAPVVLGITPSRMGKVA